MAICHCRCFALNPVCKPDFPNDELEKMKAQFEAAIKADEDDLFQFTSQGILEQVFPGTPVAYSINGKVDDLKRFKTQD